MRTIKSLFLGLMMTLSLSACAQDYEVYTTVNDVRPANPAVAKDGTLYITMHPMDGANVSVMKINKDGIHQPFPNPQWASNPKNGIGIANAIGIQATKDNKLYVLDWGNENNQAKIVAWDLTTNQLDRLYYLPNFVQRNNSFLQDFAIDQERQMIYIADMGRADLVGAQSPAIIVLNLETGQTKRVLENHASFLPNGEGIVVDDKKLNTTTPDGKQDINLGLNPIAIDPNNEWVYYGTVNAGHIYRIKSENLANFSQTDEQLAKGIEEYGPKPASDGISVDDEGNVYITSLTENGIGVTTKDNYRLLFSDSKLSWLDGLSYGPDGYFYAVVNQLHQSAPLNGGQEMGTKPYFIIRFKSLGKNEIGR